MVSAVYNGLTEKATRNAIDLSNKIYGIENWGFGYFHINGEGNLAVTPTKNRARAIDLYGIVGELIRCKQSPPFLLRFPQILDERMTALHQAFARAIDEFHYDRHHVAVYPVKVNQKSEVIKQLLESGYRYNYGLEVGSKAELAAALAMPLADDALIVCNGLKDDLFFRAAILAEKVGKKVVIIVEDFNDMLLALELGSKLGVEPRMGVRVKLYSRGSGKWEDSSGEFAKFGMSTVSLVDVLEALRQQNKTSLLKMLHFHIGSQINNIKLAKQACKEAARVYAKVYKMGFEVEYLNVGGGLGVDYDGSKTASDFSMNYSVQEFANDVIYVVGEVCGSENVPPPIIVTESGRAMVAYHSALVTNVKKVVAPGPPSRHSLGRISSRAEPVIELIDLARDINVKNFREYYHDAIQQRQDLNSLFDLGYLELEDKAKGEWLFWEVCRQASKLSHSMKQRPEEFHDLDRLLASKYVCNFSVFQSLPDFWAFDQLFPMMPIHRLNEIPTERGIVCDVTCDSDGSVDRFVDVKNVKQVLELHKVQSGQPYYLACLFLGAYQETLGDLHNLFGVVTEVNVSVTSEGKTVLGGVVRGDSVREVIEYSGFETDELRGAIAKQLSERKDLGIISDNDEHEVLATYSRVLDDYTYLK